MPKRRLRSHLLTGPSPDTNRPAGSGCGYCQAQPATAFSAARRLPTGGCFSDEFLPAAGTKAAPRSSRLAARTNPPAFPVDESLPAPVWRRSEEHTSELQSHVNLVCRLLLEKKKNKKHRRDV